MRGGWTAAFAVVLTCACAQLSLAAPGGQAPGFLWGAAFSAHQVEGGDDGSDWWDWEHQPGRIARGETTEVACDHYNRFREDFALAEQLRMNTVRLSVAWSRIETSPGVFDQAALAHYREVVLDLRARGLEPVITLHHFVHPRWFNKMGGWTNAESPKIFARFAEVVAKALAPHVSIWITFNEPMVMITEGYLKGGYPPGVRDFNSAVKVFENLVVAHGLAARVLRAHTPPNARGLPVYGVGLALNMHVFQPWHDPASKEGREDLQGIGYLEHLQNFAFLEAVQTGRLRWEIPSIPVLKKGYREARDISEARHSLDWAGVNYYVRYFISRDKKNDLGIRWIDAPGGGIYAAGLETLVTDVSRRLIDRVPIVVSENGLSDAGDGLRAGFIGEHLHALHEARARGVDVRGYWYWSLTDNFEWSSGFEPRFGLVEIDYKTLKRTVRPSANWYRDFILSHPKGP